MKIKQATQSNQHAVVIGASMAGLLAARVLSEHFEQVTIIERDRLPQEAESRKGVPQGQHVHVLLAKGESILTELFPGLFEALAQDGATRLTYADVQWYHFGVWKGQFPSPIKVYSESRPFLEQYVRSSLAARGNVRFVDACEVNRLCANEDNSRVTGVSLRYRSGEQREEALATDLVVDASGRGSRAPQWLESLGYARVEETSVKVDTGYATRIYRRPSHLPIDWKMLMVYAMPPHEKRGGVVFPIEGDRWMVSLASRSGDYPPDEEDGFLDFARSLPQPDLYEAIKEAEPLTPIFTYKYSANRWRHYERMSRFPEGFVILGDAVCNFNPVYGQGMTVAALEAKILDACLRQQPRGASKEGNGFAQRFQKALVKAVEVPWQMATGEDFRYLETEGERPWGIRLLNWYTLRINELTASNPLVAAHFYQAMHLLKPPTILFDPRVVWAVLRQELASRRQKPGASLTTDEASSPSPIGTLDAVAR